MTVTVEKRAKEAPISERERVHSISRHKVALLVGLPLVFLFVSLFLGRYFIDPGTVVEILGKKLLFLPIDKTWTDTVETIVLRVRLPRAIMAVGVGAGLSISGAAFQGMFHNPLVAPYILGVSAGAGFGAALAIVMGGGPWLLQTLAFVVGIIAVSLTYSISRVFKTTPILMLVLSGIVVAALFQALISLMKYIAPDEQVLPAIVFWLMGSLANVRLEYLPAALGSIAIGTTGLMLVRWRINVLSMGEQEARAMGVNTELLKGIIIVCTTIITSGIVSFCGIIGWVGLVIPHICRMLVGPDHRVLLPATLAVGAAYVLIIDNIARIISPSEVPLGILTALVGAPFFAFLLRKTRGGWG
jgi:iron complex transport system permease protein